MNTVCQNKFRVRPFLTWRTDAFANRRWLWIQILSYPCFRGPISRVACCSGPNFHWNWNLTFLSMRDFGKISLQNLCNWILNMGSRSSNFQNPAKIITNKFAKKIKIQKKHPDILHNQLNHYWPKATICQRFDYLNVKYKIMKSISVKLYVSTRRKLA